MKGLKVVGISGVCIITSMHVSSLLEEVVTLHARPLIRGVAGSIFYSRSRVT